MFSTQATEGHQGAHRFFATAVRWGELEPHLVFADELGDLDQDHKMQRGLAKKRLGDLVRYLREAEDHFFSALTLILLPRDLERPAVEGELDSDEEWDYLWEPVESPTPVPNRRRVGTLWVSGEVRLFPADGQHRARSAKEAIKQDPRLAREEVPVVLVPYNGFGQVRQLFSDLNLNAKPVSKTVGYDFSTRDPVALAAKAMMDRVELFDGRVNRNSNSLPRSSTNVIALNTLVEACRTLASALAARESDDDAPVTADEYLHEPASLDTLAATWQSIISAFSVYWDPVLEGTEHPGTLREHYVFPHNMGWAAIADAASQLIEGDPEHWPARLRHAAETIDWRRSATVWDGPVVVHDPNIDEDPEGRVNNTGPGVRALANIVIGHSRPTQPDNER